MKLLALKGARVIVRVDYNVPIKGTTILDTKRIEASFDTIDAVLKKGGTPVLIAHRGKGNESLRPVATFLSKKYKIVFVREDPTSPKIMPILEQVPQGTVVLFENIRRFPGEEKNTASFAKALAALGSYYVNDAFSASHRAHASIVGIPKYLPSSLGYQFERELKALAPALRVGQHPYIFIIGGAKFATKMPLLKKFLARADSVVVTGALLNNFYKASGFEIGASVVETGYDKEITAMLKNPKLHLPIDLIITRGKQSLVVSPLEVEKKDIIVDIGPESIRLIAQNIAKAKLIIWNGPTGWYEKGFTKGTMALAKAIATSKAKAIIGGGDTGALVEKIAKAKNIFVSTGGGATIEYLSTGTLPGITAIGR